MKRIIALILTCVMTFTSCSLPESRIQEPDAVNTTAVSETTSESLDDNTISFDEAIPNDNEANIESTDTKGLDEYQADIPDFSHISDPNLLRYVQDNVYMDLVNELDSEGYYVENVSAIYVSKEYLEEIAFNSKSNIFFGYSLDELDEQFQGTRYVFNLGEDGSTVVETFENYDDTLERVIKDVAIGTGVILLCVTVSVVSGGVGAPAINMIFAASAKSGSIFALSSGTLSGVASGVIKGLETGDLEQAIKSGAIAAAEGFKWGAIGGSITGGMAESSRVIALRGVKLNGLTLKEASLIQRKSNYPLDVISKFKSMDEYEIYKKAGLVAKKVNGKIALVREVDLKYKSVLAGKNVTNLQRMKQGYAPLDPMTGKAYQLHHINQDVGGTLAILLEGEHQKNASVLNTIGKIGVHNEANLSAASWASQRQTFWKSFANGIGGV